MSPIKLFIWVLLVWPTAAFWGSQAGYAEVTIQDVSNQTITFAGDKAPKPVKTGLFNLDYVGTLKPHDGSMPYFLFAANPCSDCSSERALYLIRPQDKGKPQITQFVYPGKIFDPHSRALIFQSRAFYGHCLVSAHDSGDDVYLVFQRERIDRRRYLQSSVYVAHAAPDFLRDKLLERHFPPLGRTLKLLRHHECHEIDGRNRLMVLHPRGLDWRKLQQDDQQDDAPDDPASAKAGVTPADPGPH